MRDVQSWLDEYSASHRHPVNRRLHFVCIPLIVLAIFLGLKAIPVSRGALDATLTVIFLLLLYYLRLSWRLALGMGVVFAVLYAVVVAVAAASGAALPWVALGLFVAGWVGQFQGHRIEGARPSFFKDLQFLLIGPLWELAGVYQALGLPIVAAADRRAH
jgi:uncharacterized membrane protein YGL010W